MSRAALIALNDANKTPRRCAVSRIGCSAEENALTAERDLAAIDCVSLPIHNRAKRIIARAVISKEDAALAAYHWSLNSSGYVRRNYKRKGEPQREIRLNREILGLAHGDPREGDHRNGDKLDNRRLSSEVSNA